MTSQAQRSAIRRTELLDRPRHFVQLVGESKQRVDLGRRDLILSAADLGSVQKLTGNVPAVISLDFHAEILWSHRQSTGYT
jgi:hypothetical protein